MSGNAERLLYPIVKRWLESTPHRCFKIGIDTGPVIGRIDVVGVKDVGGDLSSEVETVAVEVKKGTEPFLRATGQAIAYRVYANRVYLGDKRRDPFSSDEIQTAGHLGVGLVRIRERGCQEILASPYYRPIERLNLRLLEKLSLGKCQLCGSLFDIDDTQGKAKTTNEDLKKAVGREMGLRFWNREVAKRKKRLGIRDVSDDIESYERRFICPDCVKFVISQFKLGS